MYFDQRSGKSTNTRNKQHSQKEKFRKMPNRFALLEDTDEEDSDNKMQIRSINVIRWNQSQFPAHQNLLSLD